MLGRNLPPIPVSIVFSVRLAPEKLFLISKTNHRLEEMAQIYCSVTSSLKQEILGEKMSRIYFLQNVGFSNFPDQASCLVSWNLNFRNLLCRSDPESICGRWLLGGTSAPDLYKHLPFLTPRAPGSVFIQGFGIYVCSAHLVKWNL